jgi:hypothetical protein
MEEDDYNGEIGTWVGRSDGVGTKWILFSSHSPDDFPLPFLRSFASRSFPLKLSIFNPLKKGSD